MEEKEMEAFVAFLNEIATKQGKKLDNFIKELGEDGLKEAYAYYKSNQEKEQSETENELSESNPEMAKKGTKLKSLKKGSKLLNDCNCKKKILMKEGGQIVEKCID